MSEPYVQAGRDRLAALGWAAGRQVETANAVEALLAEGHHVWPGLTELLSEYDGLGDAELWIDGRRAAEVGPDSGWATEYAACLGCDPPAPIGGAHSEHATLWLVPEGWFFGSFDSAVWGLGSSLEEMVGRTLGAPEDVFRMPATDGSTPWGEVLEMLPGTERRTGADDASIECAEARVGALPETLKNLQRLSDGAYNAEDRCEYLLSLEDVVDATLAERDTGRIDEATVVVGRDGIGGHFLLDVASGEAAHMSGIVDDRHVVAPNLAYLWWKWHHGRLTV